MANKFNKLEEKSNHYALELIDKIKLSGKAELGGVIAELWNLSPDEQAILIEVIKPTLEQSMMSYAQWSAAVVRELKEQERNPTQKVIIESVCINLFTSILTALTTLDNKLAKEVNVPNPLDIKGVKQVLLDIENLDKPEEETRQVNSEQSDE